MDAHSESVSGVALSKWSDRPPHIQAKIAEVETELDAIWPGWRTKQPFDKVTYDLKARIKWLLKRMSLLTHLENGQVAPLDWDVMIVKDPKNPNKCYAHPVVPPKTDEEVTRNPPSPLAPAVSPIVGVRAKGPELPESSLAALHAASRPVVGTAGDIAKSLAAQGRTVTVARVEAALVFKPHGWMDTDEAWVVRWLKPSVAQASFEESEASEVQSIAQIVPQEGNPLRTMFDEAQGWAATEATSPKDTSTKETP